MLPVCYRLLNRQSISSITVKKIGYKDTSGVAQKSKGGAQKKEQQLA